MRIVVRVVVSLFPLLISVPEALALEFSWANRLGGDFGDHAEDVAVDGSGNIYTVGNFSGTSDFDPGPGVFNLTAAGIFGDVFVSKLDGEGNFIWAKSFGGVGKPDEANSVAIDATGNVYVVGFFQGTADFDPGPGTLNLTSAGEGDVFVSKLDGAGNFVWARRMGGANNDKAEGVAIDSSGSVYTVGDFEGTGDFDPGPGSSFLTSAGVTDIFVSKLDGSGNFLWAGNVGGSEYEWGRGVAVTSTGQAYLVGDFMGTADFDPGPGVSELTAEGGGSFVLKLGSAGNFIWVRLSGGLGATGVGVDSDGNVYSAGTFWGTSDFDPGPGVFNLTSAGIEDIFVAKLDTAGDFAWAVAMGATNSDSPYDLALDDSGHVHLIGRFRGTVDFDPGPEMFSLKSDPMAAAFALTLDTDGRFVWAGHVIGDLVAAGVGVDSRGNVYVVGDFQETVDFDPGPAVSQLTATSPGAYDVFIMKLDRCGLFVEQHVYGRLLFPPLCSLDAGDLHQDVYSSASAAISRSSNDRFFLSSRGEQLASLVVDDAVQINEVDSGLGPYEHRPGVPPLQVDVPIEDNFVLRPAHEITSLLPVDSSPILFELLDTDREIYGNTAVYVLRDCGIWMEQDIQDNTRLHWVSHEVQVLGASSHLGVVSGMLSHLLSDGDFSRACFLDDFFDTMQAVDSGSNPPVGDGYYYLVNGTCGSPIGYGNSSQGPRQGLPPGALCER